MNPYKALRIHNNMTQAELATRAHVTTQVVTNLEAGLYYKPPISISQLFPQLPPNMYTEWVREERIAHSHHFDNILGLPPQHFPSYRKAIHPTFRGFCRILVYQPSMLAEFERYHRNTSTLNEALAQVGVPATTRQRILGIN